MNELQLNWRNESNSPSRNYRPIFAPGWNPFNKWAIARQARRCPAKPATVALFALEQADLGVPAQQILAQLDAIERLHDRWGLANPVRTAIVRRVLEGIIKVPPPRSWPTADKVRFAV